MATKSKSNDELATLPNFAIMNFEEGDLREIMEGNLGGETLGIRDLERIKVPSGGGLAWTVTDENGDETPAKSVEGVILHVHTARTYWSEGLEQSGGGTPPDCFSNDGKIGIGQIPHDDKSSRACETCPLNQFGTADKGDGKACKETRVIYLLRPGELLPTVISVPPASLINYRRYALRLTSKAIPIDGVTTRLGLEKAKSGGGIDFLRVTFERGEPLPEELRQRVQSFAAMIRALVDSSRGEPEYAEAVSTEA